MDGEDEDNGHRNPDRVQFMPVPWTIEFGSFSDDETGVVGGFVDIYTFTTYNRLFYEPDWGIEMANYWHTSAVQTKARASKSRLIVPQVDVNNLDLGGNRKDRRHGP